MYSKEERQDLTRRFYTQFDQYCKELPQFRNRRRRWMLHHTKVRGVRFKFDPSRNHVDVALELFHQNEDERMEVFGKFEQCRELFGKGFDGQLVWDPFFVDPYGKELGRIYMRKQEVDMLNEAQWPEIFEFMAQNMLRLERNFMSIKDLFEE